MTELEKAALRALAWANEQSEVVFFGGGFKAISQMQEWTQALRQALANSLNEKTKAVHKCNTCKHALTKVCESCKEFSKYEPAPIFNQ